VFSLLQAYFLPTHGNGEVLVLGKLPYLTNDTNDGQMMATTRQRISILDIEFPTIFLSEKLSWTDLQALPYPYMFKLKFVAPTSTELLFILAIKESFWKRNWVSSLVVSPTV
jgi:hypothetical protein